LKERVSKQWLVIYTKSRSEKKVAERLLDIGFTVYCPLRTEVKIWSDRKKKVKVPVFSSYVFVQVLEAERLKLLEVHGVVNFVFWLGKPAVIRAIEIDSIKKFLSNYPLAKTKTFEIYKGQQVEVRYGQLKDKKGIITEIRNNTAMIRLENLGFELIAEVGFQEIE
jgi:transcription antitermination factor NusG